jgi:ParB/RepB/Spo0J family partition protein
MKTQTIKISQIVFAEVALRTHTVEDDHIIELANEIEERGLLNLPTLTENGEGGYIITDGARRCTALKLLLDEKRIPDTMNAQIKPKQSAIDTLADQFAGNANIKPSTNKEYINGLYKLSTEGNYSLEQLAKKVGKTVSYIQRLFKTLKLPVEVMEAAEKSKVSIANLISLSELVGRITDDELLDWVKTASDQNATDFSVTVSDEKDTIIAAAREERKGKSVEFAPKEKFIGKDDLVLMLADAEAAYASDASAINEAIVNIMRKIFSLDEKSIAAQKAEYDLKQKEKADKAEARKEERESKKAEDAESAIEDATK